MAFVTPIVLILVGLALAFMGRKLIWLFVAAAGFIFAYALTSRFLSGLDPTVTLIIAVGVGVVAGYFATKFLNLFINIAGFILIGNAALTLAGLFGLSSGIWALLAFVIGGLIGLALIRWMLAYALIIISALGGASMVVDGTVLLLNRPEGADDSWIALIVSVVIVALGIIYQYRALKAESAES